MRVLFLSFALLVILAVASCVSPGEYFERAKVVSPDLVRNVPTVVGNPGNVNAWLEIAKALGYIVLGAGGKVGVDAVRKKKAVA